MASPRARSPVDRAALDLDDKVFGEKLKGIVTNLNQLQKLSSHVYSLGKTQSLVYPNNKRVGRKELRTLFSQLGKEITGLKKHYKEHGKRKKRVRRGTAGFKNPIVINDNMVNFFREANLGPAVPTDPASGPLNQRLMLIQNRITTRAIMTPAFNIYAHVNGMQKDPANRQFLASTPLMDKYFSATYAQLAAAPQRFQKRKVTNEFLDEKGRTVVEETRVEDMSKPIARFDPQHFRYASIQSIVAKNTFSKAELGAEYNYITQPKKSLTGQELDARNQLEAQLATEQRVVSDALAYYRGQKAAATKAAKAAGRR